MKASVLNARIRLQSVSPVAIFSVGLFVTGLALLESWKGWVYAPFPLAHALLALLVPVLCNCLDWGEDLRALRSRVRLAIAPIATALLFVGAYILLYALFLNVVNRAGDADWDLLAAYKFLGNLYVERYGWATVLLAGYLLVGVWPMFGEELFYRGFVFKGLAYHMSPVVAAVLSASLFGLRHAFQLAYLLPAYPIASGVAYFVWAAGFGLLWAWLYHRSGSLWLCIATHGVNLLLAPLVFVLLKP